MQNHGKAGESFKCPKHVWATSSPCVGCQDEELKRSEARKAKREILAEKLLLAFVSRYGSSPLPELLSNLPRQALELVDQFLQACDSNERP